MCRASRLVVLGGIIYINCIPTIVCIKVSNNLVKISKIVSIASLARLQLKSEFRQAINNPILLLIDIDVLNFLYKHQSSEMLIRLFIYPRAILIIRLFLTIFRKVKLSTYFHFTRNVTHAWTMFYFTGRSLKRMQNSTEKQGLRRVFSECGIWPKYNAGFGKTQNFRRDTGFDRSSGSGNAKILARDALLGKKTVFGTEMT